MKLLSTFKYLTRDIIRLSLPIYYLFILAFTLVIHTFDRLGYIYNSSVNIGVNSTIVIIVLGLALTKSEFKMLGQFAVSRKTIMLAKGGAVVTICFVVSVIDRLLDFFATHILSTNTISFSFFDINQLSVYMNFLGNAGQLMIESALFLLSFVVRLLVYISMVFVSMLFIRMGKWMKIIVSVATGLFFVVGIPLVFSYFPRVAQNFINILAYLLGFEHGNPFIAIASIFMFSIVMYILYMLTLRRAPVNV